MSGFNSVSWLSAWSVFFSIFEAFCCFSFSSDIDSFSFALVAEALSEVFVSGFFSIFSLLNIQTKDNLIFYKKVKLVLDLQGGSNLLLETIDKVGIEKSYFFNKRNIIIDSEDNIFWILYQV